MPLINGQNIDEADYIDESEKDATPGDDAGRVTKLEADGRLGVFFTRNGAIINAGETINGATSPVPVYISKADGEAYACDANDANKYKFAAFAISNGTNGNPIKLQGSGVVSGFSGLTEGEKYYVQDTAGTIGTTPGTAEILVGVAISDTELLIQKGRRFAHGTLSQSDAGNSGQAYNNAVTLGFRPSKIKVHAIGGEATDGTPHWSDGTWINGTYAEVHGSFSDSGNQQVLAVGSSLVLNIVTTNGNQRWEGTISAISDTGFTLTLTQKADTVYPIYIHWEAEGEL